jgi:hypothetical protein
MFIFISQRVKHRIQIILALVFVINHSSAANLSGSDGRWFHKNLQQNNSLIKTNQLFIGKTFGGLVAGLTNSSRNLSGNNSGYYETINLAQLNLGLDVTINSSIKVKYRLHYGDGYQKTYALRDFFRQLHVSETNINIFVPNPANSTPTLTDVLMTFNYPMVSFVIGRGYIPMSIYQANQSVLDTWSQSFNQVNNNHIGFVIGQRHTNDFNIATYLFTRNSGLNTRGRVEFAEIANYSLEKNKLKLKLHAAYLSDGILSIDPTSDNLRSMSGISFFAKQGRPSTNYYVAIEYSGFGIASEDTRFSEWTSQDNQMNKPSIHHVQLYYSGTPAFIFNHAKTMLEPNLLTLFAGWENMSQRGEGVLSTDHSAYYGARFRYTQGIELSVKYVSDKQESLVGGRTNTHYAVLIKAIF